MLILKYNYFFLIMLRDKFRRALIHTSLTMIMVQRFAKNTSQVHHGPRFWRILSSCGSHELGEQRQSVSNTNYTVSYIFFHMTCSLVIKIRTTGLFFQSFTHSCLVFSLQWKEMLDQELTAVVTDLCCLFLLSLSRYTHSLATVF